MKTPLIAGTTLILVGVAAFALARDDRDDKPIEAPEVEAAPAPETARAELADPGTIEAEAAAPEAASADVLPEGWEIDETGHVWEPLSEKPQIRNNGDGTITMRKLIRVWQNGKMVEKPITATATPSQKRLPVKQRLAPTKANPDAAEDDKLPSSGE
jgi:hypothetical protein